MNVRTFLYLISIEIVPGPTLRRLNNLRKCASGPRNCFFKFANWILLKILSPFHFMQLKRWALQHFPQISIVNDVQYSETSKRIKHTTVVYHHGTRYENCQQLISNKGMLDADCVIACAFTGRYQILDIMVEEATSLPDGYKSIVCLVGSSADDEEYIRRLTLKNPRVIGAIIDNNPIGRKWQHAVDTARALVNYKLLAIAGSDDIISSVGMASIIDKDRLCRSDTSISKFATSLYATMEWIVLSTSPTEIHSPQMVKVNYKLESAIMPLGAGRFYSKSFIDNFDGDIFECAQNRLLDDKGFYKVQKNGYGVEYFDINQCAVISVKGAWDQMNKYDAILKSNSCDVQDFSFEGYQKLKMQLSQSVLMKLFSLNKIIN